MIDPPRPAVDADRDELVRMAEAAWDEAIGQRGGLQLAREMETPKEWAARFDELLRDDDVRLLVGGVDGVAFGFVLARTDRPRDDSPAIIEVVAVYTDPDARGVGIGAGMMADIATWAEGIGAAGLDALVLPGNRSAKNFFESFGMKARLIRVHRQLTADG